MTLNRAVTFMKYLADVVSLIWNKITFRLSNLLNRAELLVNELIKNISKKNYQHSFFIRFITASCKDFKSL